LIKKHEVFKRLFPPGSAEIKMCEEDILACDSLELKAETDKYLRFLHENNERPTRGFCKLDNNKKL